MDIKCKKCETVFVHPKQRGRPPHKCPACRAKPVATPETPAQEG